MENSQIDNEEDKESVGELDTRGNNFLKNGDEVQVRNRTKVAEIIIRKRRFFAVEDDD